jgi:hypothetical protein
LTPSLPSKYPHLLPEDAKLWNEYQLLHHPRYHSFLYDVAVGPGRDPGENFPDNIRTMALQLSKLRLDVVGIDSNSIEIFEITQSAGLKAAGQAIVYPHMLKVTWELTIPVSVTIVCRSCRDDVESVLAAYNIRLVVIPNTE